MPSGFVKTSDQRIGANPQRAIDHVTEAIAGVYVKQSIADAWYNLDAGPFGPRLA